MFFYLVIDIESVDPMAMSINEQENISSKSLSSTLATYLRLDS